MTDTASPPPAASDVHLFVPDRRSLHRENVATAIVSAVLVAGFLYAVEVRNVAILVGAGLAGAALMYGVYWLRARLESVDAIELSPRGATVVRKGKRQTLAWEHVKAVRHGYRGGEFWLLTARKGHRSLLLRGDGIPIDAAREMGTLIDVHVERARAGE